MNSHYSQFITKVKNIYSLRSAQALLGWDQETNMPSGGGEGRAQANSALSMVIQEKYCEKQLGELIEELEGCSLSVQERANVREVKRDREKLLKTPLSLTEEIAKTTSLSQQVWAEARAENNSAKFNPWLKKVVELRRQEAECIGYPNTPYDAMLNQYEPNVTTSEVQVILDQLQKDVIPLLQKITHSEFQPSSTLLSQVFDVDGQRKFNQKILKEMTFDLEKGRLDEAAHPFTEGVWPRDVRLTTRYSERDLLSGIFGTIHEGGHGLYEQGFQEVFYGTPMAEAISLGVHESQSRLWENQIGRSLPYWKRYFPVLKKMFSTQLGDVGLNDFYASVNRVEPSLIRVEADELTYNLHIALRFDMEKALFSGEIEVDDLENLWKQKMKQMLGVEPESVSEGYMQDVHWSLGLFGYFPTYSLGNIISAQLFKKMSSDLGNMNSLIEEGAFEKIKEWLQKNIYSYGRELSPTELVEKATGEAPNAAFFKEYLEKKYSELYKL